MKYAIALVMALMLNATANLMMKFGVERFKASGATLPHGAGALAAALLSNWVLLLGLCFFAANVVLYTYALKAFPISTAYPIMVSTGFAIIMLVAWRYLGETLTRGQWAGVILILLGVWLVAREMKPSDALAAGQARSANSIHPSPNRG